MLRVPRLLFVALGVVLLSTLAWSTVALGQPASESSSPIRVVMTADVNAGGVAYSITIENTSSSDVGDIFVAGSVPQGAEFSGEVATPAGGGFRGFEGAGTSTQAAVWLSTGVRANSVQGPFVYQIRAGKATDLAAYAWLHWRLPADTTLLSARVDSSATVAAVHSPSSSRYSGDCLSCHSDVVGRATLSPKVQEAHTIMMSFTPGYVAAKSATNENCAFCHRGTDLRDHSAGNLRRDVDVASCILCHGRQGPGKKFYSQ